MFHLFILLTDKIYVIYLKSFRINNKTRFDRTRKEMFKQRSITNKNRQTSLFVQTFDSFHLISLHFSILFFSLLFLLLFSFSKTKKTFSFPCHLPFSFLPLSLGKKRRRRSRRRRKKFFFSSRHFFMYRLIIRCSLVLTVEYMSLL